MHVTAYAYGVVSSMKIITEKKNLIDRHCWVVDFKITTKNETLVNTYKNMLLLLDLRVQSLAAFVGPIGTIPGRFIIGPMLIDAL